jgi:hypothetical protein
MPRDQQDKKNGQVNTSTVADVPNHRNERDTFLGAALPNNARIARFFWVLFTYQNGQYYAK